MKKVYSRVIRLCKHDDGIENLGVWKTFEKARLNCSMMGESNADNGYSYPFYFDEIQHVHFDESNNLIYAIFSTPSNGIKGSAVCVYDVESLENAFKGPFKHQKSKDSIWEPYNEPIQSNKCGGVNNKDSKENTKYVDSSKFQLKDLSVQPLYNRPMLVLQNKRLTKLTVDNVLTKNEEIIRVLFLSTEDNTILKYMLLNFLDFDDSFNKIKPTNIQITPTLCLLEEMEIFESNSKMNLPNLINNLVFVKQQRSKESPRLVRPTRNLLIATKYNLIKMPVANCESHTNYFSCLSLMDPYW